MNDIFVPFNTPSSKNSKIATKRGVFHSKTVMNYLRNLGIQHYSASKKTVTEYKNRPNLFRQAFKDWGKPTEFVKIGLHFVRDSRRDADFQNICQLIFDLMVAHDFIEDDSMKYVLPFPLEIDGVYWKIDKINPGVFIRIL
jgi:hypothetical protein